MRVQLYLFGSLTYIHTNKNLMKLDTNQIDDWEWEIKPSVGWFDFSIKKIFNHANLIWSFTKRDLQSSHKQTVLGNFWLVFQPLITTIVYTLVFANIIKVSTYGMPPLLFYLTGNMLWSFFADSMFGSLYTFRTNAHILSKVYFPRIILPLSSVLVQAYKLGINLLFFILAVLFYQFKMKLISHSYHGTFLFYCRYIFSENMLSACQTLKVHLNGSNVISNRELVSNRTITEICLLMSVLSPFPYIFLYSTVSKGFLKRVCNIYSTLYECVLYVLYYQRWISIL